MSFWTLRNDMKRGRRAILRFRRDPITVTKTGRRAKLLVGKVSARGLTMRAIRTLLFGR